MDSWNTDNSQLSSTASSQFGTVTTGEADESLSDLFWPEELALQRQLQDNLNVQVKTEVQDEAFNILPIEETSSAQHDEVNSSVHVKSERLDESNLLDNQAMPQAQSVIGQVKYETPNEEESELLPCSTNLESTVNVEDIKTKNEEDDINDDDVTPDKITDESDDDTLMLMGISQPNSSADKSANENQQHTHGEASTSNVCDPVSTVDAPIMKISVKSLSKLIDPRETVDTGTNASNDITPTTEYTLNSNGNNWVDDENAQNDLNCLSTKVNSIEDSKDSSDSEFEDVPSNFFDELLHSPTETKNVKQETNEAEQLMVWDSQSEEELNRNRLKYTQMLQSIENEKKQPVEKKRKRRKKKKHRRYTSSSEDDDDDGVSYRRGLSQERSRSSRNMRSRSREKSRNTKRRRSYSRSRSKSRIRSRRYKKERRSRSISEHRSERKRHRNRDSSSPELWVRSDELAKNKTVKLEKIMDRPITIIPPPSSLETRVEKVKALIKMQQKAFVENEISELYNGFVYTQTISSMNKTRSLNTNLKNRSPLCSLNNVFYSLTSARPRISLSAYGFTQPSKPTAEIMRLVNINSSRLEKCKKSVKMPPKLLKMLKSSNDDSESFQRDAQSQTEPKYFKNSQSDVGTQCSNENLIDTSTMTHKQKYAIFLCEEILKMCPKSELDENQHNTRLIDAVKAARSSLKYIKREY